MAVRKTDPWRTKTYCRVGMTGEDLINFKCPPQYSNLFVS